MARRGGGTDYEVNDVIEERADRAKVPALREPISIYRAFDRAKVRSTRASDYKHNLSY